MTVATRVRAGRSARDQTISKAATVLRPARQRLTAFLRRRRDDPEARPGSTIETAAHVTERRQPSVRCVIGRPPDRDDQLVSTAAERAPGALLTGPVMLGIPSIVLVMLALTVTGCGTDAPAPPAPSAGTSSTSPAPAVPPPLPTSVVPSPPTSAAQPPAPPAGELPAVWRGVDLERIPTAEKVVALTFDADALPTIIEGLRARGYRFVDLAHLTD